MKNIILVILGIVVVFGLLITSMVRSGRSGGNEEQSNNQLSTMEELKSEDVKVGSGAEAKDGDMVTVHYVGTLVDGTKFDSSRDRGEPFVFQLGTGMVIQGWDMGVKGMKVGGIRKLVIPPSLGYGSEGIGPIPGNATLNFEVELLNVQPPQAS